MNTMTSSTRFGIAVFSLYEPHDTVYLTAVYRVVQSFEITPLPIAPDLYPGAIDVKGLIIMIIAISKRIQILSLNMTLDSRIISTHAPR